MIDLYEKYDISVPRYTSYPPVPNWKDNFSTDNWLISLQHDMRSEDTNWSLYLHMPFCESQCHFCACNNIITKSHDQEERYIEALLLEWKVYLNSIPEFKAKKLRQLHLGGGTPSFFSATNLNKLFETLFFDLQIDENCFDGSIEIDPRRYNIDQLKILKKFHFNRISLGVQDFDPLVQKNVNRIQSYELVEKCVDDIRKLGFSSINFDLIYGLPGQTEESMQSTAEKVMLLQPDRIAFYSLAVVPWLKPAHGGFSKFEIKRAYSKRKLYEIAKKVFTDCAYISLGMDHFAKPDDALAKSIANNSLHRNFMGYTEYSTDVLLGLGLSSISENTIGFHQNHKKLDDYYNQIFQKNIIPTMKSHLLSNKDKLIKEIILNLMTKHQSSIDESVFMESDFSDMLQENLIEIKNDNLLILENGIPFIRNICSRIDPYFNAPKFGTNIRFSSGV